VRRMSIWLVVALALLLAGCDNGHAQATQQADALLAKCLLHPAGAASWKTVTVWATEPFGAEVGASHDLGLNPNLDDLAGEKVQVLCIPLKEHVQGNGRTLRAYFFVSHGTVIGAYMNPDSGDLALSLLDRADLVQPNQLSPHHLVFNGVRDVSVGRIGTDWAPPVSVTDPAAVKTILTMLSALTPKRGEINNVAGDEIYDLGIIYDSGWSVTCDLTTHSHGRQTFVRFGGIPTFNGWYYVAPAGLKTYVKAVLGSK
jgi:hypothetical protein